MPIVSRALGAIALCLAVAGSAGADVVDYLGMPVGSVRLLVESRETADPALMKVVETVVGQPLSMAEVRESIVHLFSLGRFEDVRVDATLDGGRVALRYELVPVHPITRIRFEGPGGPDIDTGELRRSLIDRYGASPALGRVADMTRLVTDALRERGYLHPVVTSRAEIEHAPEHATLVLTIQPGVRTTIGAVDIVGRPTVSKDEFLKRLGVAPGSPFRREALNARIEQYIEQRRRSGYYEAKIVPVAAGRRRPRGESHADGGAGPPRERRVRRGCAAGRQTQRVCARRARRVRRRRSARRLEQPDRGLPARARVSRRQGAARARRVRQRARDHLHGHQGSAVSGVHGRGVGQRVDPAGRLRGGAAPEGRRALFGEPAGRRRAGDRRPVSPPRFCVGEGQARRRAGARRRHGVPGAGGRPHRHHGGRQNDGGGGDVRGQSGARRGGAARPGAFAAGRTFRAEPARGRSGCDPAGLPESRVRERDGRGQTAVQSGRYARHAGVRGARRAAGLRRSRAHRRERAHAHGDHRARAAGEARRSVQPGRHQREPAAADRARPVPARAHHRAAPRRRDDARSARDDRGSAPRRSGTAAVWKDGCAWSGGRRTAAWRPSSSRWRPGPSSTRAAGTCSARTDRPISSPACRSTRRTRRSLPASRRRRPPTAATA